MDNQSKMTLRRCEIVSRLTDDSGNILFDLVNANKVLEERQCIVDYAYIIHDKDVYTEKEINRNTKKVVGALKEPHIHLCLRFNAPQHLDCIAKWFGISENFIEKIKGKWENALLYLTHYNAPEKYQYSINEVVANFDVQEVINNDASRKHIDMIIERILNGDITEYNKTFKINPMLLVKFNHQVETAFKVRAEILAATSKERKTECIYIYGDSELGKSTLARKIADSRELAYFLSSGSNDIMFGYLQEPCVILDELRPECMPLSDLLKMLDNHFASSVKSRYRNLYLNCELIIITTTLSIEQFFADTRKDVSESIVQFKRRCGTYIEVKPDRLYISRWDSKKRTYSKPIEYVNDVVQEYKTIEEITDEDIEKFISNLIPFIVKPEQKKNGFDLITEDEQKNLPFNK